MSSKRQVGLRTLFATIVVLGVAALATAPAAPTDCRNAEVRTNDTGTWTIYDVPAFERGDTIVTAHAVDRDNPNRWYITNGLVIAASQDGGCTWSTSYEIPELATEGQPGAVTPVRIHTLTAGGGRVIAAMTGTQTVPDPGNLPVKPPATGVRPEAGSAVTLVVRSEDGGAQWSAPVTYSNDGGAPGPLQHVPGNPEVVFLGTGMTIRRSTDGGETFPTAFRLAGAKTPSDPASYDPSPLGASAAGGINQIVPDPVDGSTVFVRGDRFVWRSENGGVIFNPVVSEAATDDTALEGPTIFGPAFGRIGEIPGHVLFTRGAAKRPGVDEYLRSQDGGATFEVLKREQLGGISGAPIGIATGTESRQDVIISTMTFPDRGQGSVYRWQPVLRRFIDVDQIGFTELRDPEVGKDGATRFFMGAQLVAWELPKGGAGSLPRAPDPGVGGKKKTFPLGPDGEPPRPPDTPQGPQARLTPEGGTVKVPAGGSTDVDYTLELPARPSRLDTFFLLDTSGSTEPYIVALSRGLTRLAQNLSQMQIDAWFGLGEYQDTGGVRYRRRSDLRPPTDDFLRYQLDSIRTTGGQEPGYTAIHQAITGRGVPKPAGSTLPGDPVPPNSNAHWRRGTARLLLQVADEPFSHDKGVSSRDDAVEALVRHNVSYVGTVVTRQPLPEGAADLCGSIDRTPRPQDVSPVRNDDDPDSYALLCQMVDLARAAGTLAPAGGVDCDGDNAIDIPAGKPMVCVIQNARVDGLPDAVKRLASAVRLDQQVTLVPAPRPGGPSIEVTPAGIYDAINMRADNRLSFKTKFSCEAEQAGKEYEVTMQALANDLPVAEAKPKVACGEKPAVVPPVVPPKKPRKAESRPLPERAVVAALPPPATAPMPVPQQPPPPANNPISQHVQAQAPSTAQQPGQASAQQFTQVQASAAEQEKQIQVAVERVRTDDTPESSSELHFAASPADAPGDWPWLIRTLGIAGVLGVAGAAMSRRRTNTRTRKVPIR